MFAIDCFATALSAARCTLSASCQFALFYLCLVEGSGVCVFFCLFVLLYFDIYFLFFGNFWISTLLCNFCL